MRVAVVAYWLRKCLSCPFLHLYAFITQEYVHQGKHGHPCQEKGATLNAFKKRPIQDDSPVYSKNTVFHFCLQHFAQALKRTASALKALTKKQQLYYFTTRTPTRHQRSTFCLRGSLLSQCPPCMLMILYCPPPPAACWNGFPSVDTSDCVVTVELGECGFIMAEGPSSMKW